MSSMEVWEKFHWKIFEQERLGRRLEKYRLWFLYL